MLRMLRILSVALLVTTAVAPPAWSCPMCKVANEDNPDPSLAARPRGYMYSILFMLSMPATITAFFGITFYRMTRQQQDASTALLNEFDDRS